MIINSTTYDHSPLTLRSWLDDEEVIAFKSRERRLDRIAELVVHESVIAGWDATQHALDRHDDRLGCQLMIDCEGRVTQHGDLVARMSHVGSHNSASVGVEIVNPYEPDKMKDPWHQVIDAPWAHGNRYVLPTPAQCEALTLIVEQLTTNEQLPIPRVWRGMVDGRWQLRKMPAAPEGKEQAARKPGIWSHQQIGNHSDGGWPLLYAWMRLEAGLSPADSYAEARSRATGVRRDLGLLDLVT